MTKTLTELQREIGDWQSEMFPYATIQSAAAHLAREANEVLDAAALVPAIPRTREQFVKHHELLMEVADVVMLAMGVATLARFDLQDAVAFKFALNRGRTWGEPDHDGVVEHVRTASGGHAAEGSEE